MSTSKPVGADAFFVETSAVSDGSIASASQPTNGPSDMYVTCGCSLSSGFCHDVALNAAFRAAVKCRPSGW